MSAVPSAREIVGQERLHWVALYLLAQDFDEDTGGWSDTAKLVIDARPYAALGLTPAAFLTAGEAQALARRMEQGLPSLNTPRGGAYAARVIHAAALPASCSEWRPHGA